MPNPRYTSPRGRPRLDFTFDTDHVFGRSVGVRPGGLPPGASCTREVSPACGAPNSRRRCVGSTTAVRLRPAECWKLGGAYITKGQPERWAELCRNMITRNPGPHIYTRS
jgi:hypothetical protein